MYKKEFIQQFLPAAQAAGEHFKLNPVVILAQAAIESGWGESVLCKVYHNYFGITGYGKSNIYWNGNKTEPGEKSHLQFRIYPTPQQSFFDFARLITTAYPFAAAMSFHPEAYAKEISYSHYISEMNGDNRADYQKMLVNISKYITGIISGITH